MGFPDCRPRRLHDGRSRRKRSWPTAPLVSEGAESAGRRHAAPSPEGRDPSVERRLERRGAEEGAGERGIAKGEPRAKRDREVPEALHDVEPEVPDHALVAMQAVATMLVCWIRSDPDGTSRTPRDIRLAAAK